MVQLSQPYFGHLMRTANSLEKSLMLGKTEGRRRRGHQRMRWLDVITDTMDMSLSKLVGDSEGQGGLACCSPRDRRVGHHWATEQQQQLLQTVHFCIFTITFNCGHLPGSWDDKAGALRNPVNRDRVPLSQWGQTNGNIRVQSRECFTAGRARRGWLRP